MRRKVPVLIGVAAVMLTAAAAQAFSSTAQNYLLHCEGCHQRDGSGQPGLVPDFRGSVARFLHFEDGRQYLGRVPGTSQSLLNDAERADVLNWIVTTFDASDLPQDFVPYSADEMATYRRDPLSQANVERARLVQFLSNEQGAPKTYYASTTSAAVVNAPTSQHGQAPTQFALCAACHPTSSDGASAMGPNLRGVIGRRSGSLPGFRYSPAMVNAGIVWTPETLDEFLRDVQQKVPGTLMAITPIDSASDRAAIIQYLQTLQ